MSANDSEPAQQSSHPRTPKKPERKQASNRQKPSTALTRAREAQPSAEPAEQAQPSTETSPEDQQSRVWEMHLRGLAKSAIARETGLHRDTVSRIITDCYRAFGAERKARMKRGLDAAVARMRRVQQQAWADHDADDERERTVLEQAEYGARYTSQRSAYLRLILDAEKEIARLEGLYAEDAPDVLGVLFRVIRVEKAERTVSSDGADSD